MLTVKPQKLALEIRNRFSSETAFNLFFEQTRHQTGNLSLFILYSPRSQFHIEYQTSAC